VRRAPRPLHLPGVAEDRTSPRLSVSLTEVERQPWLRGLERLRDPASRRRSQALAGSPARRRRRTQRQSATWPPRCAFLKRNRHERRDRASALPRKEEPVLARFRLTPTAALGDKHDCAIGLSLARGGAEPWFAAVVAEMPGWPGACVCRSNTGHRRRGLRAVQRSARVGAPWDAGLVAGPQSSVGSPGCDGRGEAVSACRGWWSVGLSRPVDAPSARAGVLPRLPWSPVRRSKLRLGSDCDLLLGCRLRLVRFLCAA
jgi:hypothetical protein